MGIRDEDNKPHKLPEAQAIKAITEDTANSNLLTPPTVEDGEEKDRGELEKKLNEEITDARKKHWEIGKMNPPHGSWKLNDPDTRLARKAKQEMAAEQKNRLRAAYEEKTVLALNDIATLQRTIVRLGMDPSMVIEQEHLERLKLALKGADQVLNRALGRPVAHVESNVTHNIAEEIARMHDEWIVEAEIDE